MKKYRVKFKNGSGLDINAKSGIEAKKIAERDIANEIMEIVCIENNKRDVNNSSLAKLEITLLKTEMEEMLDNEDDSQLDLEPQGAAMGYPKQIGKELYELSNGDQVKGMREAYRKQEKLADYKINLLAYNEEIISQSMKAYGCWREGLKKLKQSFVQMKLVDDDNKQNLRAVK